MSNGRRRSSAIYSAENPSSFMPSILSARSLSNGPSSFDGFLDGSFSVHVFLLCPASPQFEHRAPLFEGLPRLAFTIGSGSLSGSLLTSDLGAMSITSFGASSSESSSMAISGLLLMIISYLRSKARQTS